jgi:hypothetical protein
LSKQSPLPRFWLIGQLGEQAKDGAMSTAPRESGVHHTLYRYVGVNLLMGVVVALLYSREFYEFMYVRLPFRCFPDRSHVSLMRLVWFLSFLLVVLGVAAIGFVWFRVHWRALMPCTFRCAWLLKATFLLAWAVLVSAILFSKAVAAPVLGLLVRCFFYGHSFFAWLGNTYAQVYDRLLPQ